MLNFNSPSICTPAIILDFETRSKVSLPDVGNWVYAHDLTTDILCCTFIEINSSCEIVNQWLWYPHDGPLPTDLIERLKTIERVGAWDTNFDQLIYECVGRNDYAYPYIPDEKWYCVQSQARVNALPGGLEKCARALKLPVQKDRRGKDLIRKLSVPQPDGEFLESQVLLREMGEYCLTDSLVSVGIYVKTRELTALEMSDYRVNRSINERGVRIDRLLAFHAFNYADAEVVSYGEKLSQLTNGQITKHTQAKRISSFLAESFSSRGLDSFVNKMLTEKGNYSCDSDRREFFLEHSEQLTDLEFEVVNLLDQANKTSVSKFKSMYNMTTEDDDRVHNAFIYAGAGQTKRFSAKGLQLHNFTRDCFHPSEAAQIRKKIVSGAPLLNPMQDLSKMLRPCLIPKEGHVFISADWSAIEARIFPWLTLDLRAEKILEQFKNNHDVYTDDGKTVGASRVEGKIIRLSGQYGGGADAIDPILRSAGCYFTKTSRLIMIEKFNAKNPYCKQFWYAVMKAMKLAVDNPGETFRAGRLGYYYAKDLMDGSLLCILPDGSCLTYPQTIREGRDLYMMKASLNPAKEDTEWPKMRMWHGLGVENPSQAVGACILRAKMPKFREMKIPIVAHTHDEFLFEVPKAEAEEKIVQIKQEMEFSEGWYSSLPLHCSAKIMTVYGKA